jgi:uncharacterized cysteine cluster protein YcgN (CxxCxxCC family)
MPRRLRPGRPRPVVEVTTVPFWRRKRLDQMTRDEWESLCDGCGKCCLHKLEDADTGEIAMTDVSCSLLDLETCRCTDYGNRQAKVPDCVKLTRANLPKLRWLPDTCAYRLLYQGNDLPEWHYLVSGDRNAVHAAGQSVKGKAVSEAEVEDLERHVTDWLNNASGDWIYVPEKDPIEC